MAQEMYKHDALLHLLWAMAVVDGKKDANGEWELVTDDEDEYYEKVKKAEGITISFSEINDKLKKLVPVIGKDGVINEALKATNGCSREWRTKVYGYMWRMALKSNEGHQDNSNCSDNEYALIKKARDYFELTEEEDDRAIDLTLV